MLDKRTLIDRLEKYDLQESETSPGFRNTLTNICYLKELIVTDRREEDIENLQRNYSVLTDHYSRINFKELEDHKDEPAVKQLFKTRELLVALSFAIWGFTEADEKNKELGIANHHNMQGYREISYILDQITELDKNSHYRNRIKQLKEENIT